MILKSVFFILIWVALTAFPVGAQNLSCVDIFSPTFEVGIVDDRVHIVGQSNHVRSDWTQLPKTAKELATFSNQNFKLLVHAGSNAKKIKQLIANPDLLQEAFSFSASVIDQDHRNTYGKYGVILSAPPENILATSSGDMGAPFAKVYSKAEIDQARDEGFFYSIYFSKNPVMTPQQLLQQTKVNGWNEVMVAGTTVNAGSVGVIGLFLKTKNGRVVADDELKAEVYQLAKTLNLSVLLIEASVERDF